MAFWRGVKRRVRAAVPPLLFLGLVAYFGHSAVNGDRGLKATVVRLQQLKDAQSELGQAEGERDSWERKVAGLQPSHLDPDTLDERARALVNMADPNDIVVPYAKDKRLF